MSYLKKQCFRLSTHFEHENEVRERGLKGLQPGQRSKRTENEMRAYLNQSETVRRAITLLHFVAANSVASCR